MFTEPYLEDLNRDIQSPEPELLYYGRDPDPDVGQEHLQHQIEAVTEDMKELSWDGSGAQDWYDDMGWLMPHLCLSATQIQLWLLVWYPNRP